MRRRDGKGQDAEDGRTPQGWSTTKVVIVALLIPLSIWVALESFGLGWVAVMISLALLVGLAYRAVAGSFFDQSPWERLGKSMESTRPVPGSRSARKEPPDIVLSHEERVRFDEIVREINHEQE